MIQLSIPTIIEPDRQFHIAVDLRDMDGVDVTGFSGYTVVTKIRRQENLLGGSRIRVVIRSPNNTDSSLSAVYIGEVATSGNAYDFASSPTQLTFNGKTALTLTAKQVYASDPVTLDFNSGKAHIVAMNVSSSALRRFTAPAGERNVISFYKAAVSEAGTAAKGSGYTAQADTAYGLTLIRASRAPDDHVVLSVPDSLPDAEP